MSKLHFYRYELANSYKALLIEQMPSHNLKITSCSVRTRSFKADLSIDRHTGDMEQILRRVCSRSIYFITLAIT